MQITGGDRMQSEGKRNALRRLSLKCGQLPEEVTARVQAIESPEELDAYLDRVLFANSLAEMGLEGADPTSNSGEQN